MTSTEETQALLPVTPEDVEAALATFDGGLVRQNDERNARGYTTFYHPKDSMRAVLEEFSAHHRISHSRPGDVGMREALNEIRAEASGREPLPLPSGTKETHRCVATALAGRLGSIERKARAALSSPLSATQEDAERSGVGLGRFGHHPDPSIDFCQEVEELESIVTDLEKGLRTDEDVPSKRIERAMSFRVGGCEFAVGAKSHLREIDERARALSTPQRQEYDGDAVREALADVFAAWDAHVEANDRTNAAIPAIDATRAERAVYDERYRASEEAKREWYRAMHRFIENPAARAALAHPAQATPSAVSGDAGEDWRGTPYDLRAKGWSVAVHNDYRQHGLHYTFWLFTKDGLAVKGEGLTDAEALDAVRAQVATLPSHQGAE